MTWMQRWERAKRCRARAFGVTWVAGVLLLVAFLPQSQPHGAVVLVEAVVLVVSLLATWAYDTEVKRIEEEPR